MTDRLAREAAAIADRLPLIEPAAATCRCGSRLDDGRHLIAASDAELRRAAAVARVPARLPPKRTLAVRRQTTAQRQP